jgi:hypothetical protein
MNHLADRIHEHNGRFYLAAYSDRSNSYTAPMTPSSRKLTGCSAVSATRVAGIAASPNVYSYSTRAAAMRRARIIWGDD